MAMRTWRPTLRDMWRPMGPAASLADESRSLRARARSLPAAMAVAASVLVAGLSSAPAQADSFSGAFLAARHAATERDVVAAAYYFNRAVDFRPDAIELLEPALIYSVGVGDIDRGVELAERILKARPQDRLSALVLAADALHEDRFERARERLEDAQGQSAFGLLSDLLMAWSDVGLGDAAAAQQTLSDVDDRTLEKLFKLYHAGLIAAQRGDHAAAVEAYRGSIEAARSATGRMTQALGASLELAGRVDEATAAYDDLLERDSSDATVRAERQRLADGGAPSLLAANAREGAAEALYGLGAALSQDEGARFGLVFAQLALHLKPDFPEATTLIGDIFAELDQYNDAADAYARVDQDSLIYSIAQLGRATALDRLDRDDEALETLRALGDRAPEDANIYFAMGEFFSRHERYTECVDAYDDGVQRLGQTTERHWIVYYGRGICLERTGVWERAEENFTLALELQPDQPDVLNYLGYSLVEQGRRLEEARDMIERAVERRPDSGYIVDSLGWVLYRLGDFDGAVVHLEEAVRLSPVEPVITDHFGDALWKVGRKNEARFQWRRALSFEPEEDVEVRIRRKLDVGLDVVLEEEAAAVDAEATTETSSDAPSQDKAAEQGG